MKEDVRQKKRVGDPVKEDVSNKHGSLICLKNVKKEEASSISRDPVQKKRKNSHQSVKSKKSQSPTPKQLRFEIKNQEEGPVETTLKPESEGRRLKLQTKDLAQSYSIPVHSGFHTVKSVGGNAPAKKSFNIKPSTKEKLPAPPASTKEVDEPQRGKSQSPNIKKMLVEFKDYKDYDLMCQMVAEIQSHNDRSSETPKLKEMERE